MQRQSFYESAVDSETLSPSDAPVLILLTPESEGTGPFAKNLSEEGYRVVVVDYLSGNDDKDAVLQIQKRLDEALGSSKQQRQNVALITLGLKEQDAGLVSALVEQENVGAAVHYGPQFAILPATGDGGNSNLPPFICHVSEDDTEQLTALQKAASDGIISSSSLPFDPTHFKPRASIGPRRTKPSEYFYYPSISTSDSSSWALSFPFSSNTRHFAFAPTRTDADRSAASLAYSRTLQLLQDTVGPRFDREQLWDRHTYFEFAERDSFKTMQTMVPDPFVNHVSSLTGGAGYKQLARFYEHHFTKSSPPDTKLVGISRTLGPDRVIDEMVYECTHTQEIEYFLPGVAPTNKRLRIPMVGIVNLRGDKLAFESLYWDQASALVQLGLLDPKEKGGLPIAGQEVPDKVLDPFGVPSNELLTNWKLSEHLPIPGLSS